MVDVLIGMFVVGGRVLADLQGVDKLRVDLAAEGFFVMGVGGVGQTGDVFGFFHVILIIVFVQKDMEFEKESDHRFSLFENEIDIDVTQNLKLIFKIDFL